MNEVTKTIRIEQPPYDWTKGRAVELDDPGHEPFPAHLGYRISPTEEESLWWEKIFGEIQNKIDTGEPISLAYLSHPILGKLIAFWNKTKSEIIQRENYGSINERQKLDRVKPGTLAHYQKASAFRSNWANKILRGELPSKEELKQKEPEENMGLEYQLLSCLLQGVAIKHPEMQLKLPYIGSISFEEAQTAIRSFLEQKMREVKKIDAAEDKRKRR